MEFAAEADLICSFRAAALKYLGVEDEKRKLELSKLRQDALTDFVAQKDALPQTMVVVSCVLYVLRKNFQNVDPATLSAPPSKAARRRVCVLGNRFPVEDAVWDPGRGAGRGGGDHAVHTLRTCARQSRGVPWLL